MRIRPMFIAALVVTATGLTAVLLTSPATGSEPTTLRATVLRHEALIADCMRARGHEYVAALPRDVLLEEAAQQARQHGRDVGAAVDAARSRMPADPNEKLLAALPPAQQQAWADTLWGTPTSSGCYDTTLAQAWGKDLAADLRRAQDLLDRAKADPEVVRAERAYLGCMAARDYPVTDTQDIFAVVGHRGENLEPDAARALKASAYAAHDACYAPYQQAFDTAHRRLLGTR